RAKAAAQRALTLDNSLGEAYGALGLCGFFYDWDWAAAERAFRRSIELAPTALGARLWFPLMLAGLGRSDEAIEQARHAVDLDPIDVNALTCLGQTLYMARRV